MSRSVCCHLLIWLALVCASPLWVVSAAAASESDLFETALRRGAGGDYPGMKEALRQLVQARPEKGLYWFNLGNVHYLMKEYGAAVRAYKQVERLRSPLAPAARLYTARTYRKAGRLFRAEHLLQPVLRQRLPGALQAEAEEERILLAEESLHSGLNEYERNHWRKALARFKISVRLQPDPATYTLLGLTYEKLGREPRAERMLQKAAELSRERGTRDDVESLLTHLRRRGSVKVWRLSADAALAYNSNVLRDTAESEREESRGVRLGLGVWRELRRTSDFLWAVRAGVFFEDYSRLPNERYYDVTVGTEVRRYFGRWLFSLVPGYSEEFFDSRPYLHKPTVHGRLSQRFGAYEWGTVFEYLRILSSQSRYAYLDGSTSGATLYGAYGTGAFYGSLGLQVRSVESGDIETSVGRLPLAHTAYGAVLRTLWEVSAEWEVQGRVSYMTANYWNPDLLDGRKRVDNLIRILAKSSFAADAGLRLFVSGEYLNNRSTFGEDALVDKNYSQALILTGVEWEIDL